MLHPEYLWEQEDHVLYILEPYSALNFIYNKLPYFHAGAQTCVPIRIDAYQYAKSSNKDSLDLLMLNVTDSLIVARGPKTLSPPPPWSSPPQELPNGTQPQRSKNLNSFQHNVDVMGMPRLHHGEQKRAWTGVHHVCDPATTAPQ